jgi:regulator of protease activity HflC (stomatin/prohibitin superfamily)
MEAVFAFFLCFVLFIFLIALSQALKVIQQYEKGIVMRLGKFAGLQNPGLTFLIPFLDRLIKVDMRERVINVEPQQVITEDNVTVSVDAVVYYKVVDPVKAEFEVEDFNVACTTLAQTNLRNVIGDMNLDDTLTSRDLINTNLREVLDEATNPWGVKVTRVEVQRIEPPVDITEAMSRQMKAERDKRAAILESEGFKQSKILEAEGIQQSEILKAEGDAKAQVARAKAEAEAVKLVSEAAEKYFKERAQLKMKLEVTENSLKNNSKIIVPSDSDLVNVIGDDKGSVIPVKK